MDLCARCKKRMAVVFVSRLENGKVINEGICLKCARELGIKPINELMDKMGLTEEDMDRMDEEMENMLSIAEDCEFDEDESDDGQEGRAPAFDLKKMFGAFPVNASYLDNKAEKESDSDSEKKDRK